MTPYYTIYHGDNRELLDSPENNAAFATVTVGSSNFVDIDIGMYGIEASGVNREEAEF